MGGVLADQLLALWSTQRSSLPVCRHFPGLAQITQGYTGHDAGAYAQKLEINCDYLERRG